MNIRRLTPPALFSAAALAVAAFAADSSSPAVNATFVDPESREAADIRAAGESAINRLAFTMVNELNAALAKGPVENAVAVAHLKNLPKTGDRVTGLPRIAAIRLTSNRLRSGANAADAADRLALDRVLKDLASDAGPPKILVQRIDPPSGPSEWRVYRPLGIMSVCLKCHGDPAEQPGELRAKLTTAYANDQATGYHAGEFRGILRVTVDNGPPPAQPSPSGTPAKATPKKK